MRRLTVSSFLLCALFSGFVACGGKVAFDGLPGQTSSSSGGHGGATSSSTASTGIIDGPSTGTTMSSSVASSGQVGVTVGVTSTGTGTTCDCGSVCTKLAGCGIPQQQCLMFCPQANPMQLDCLCNLPGNCQGVQNCFGMGASTSSGGMQGQKLPPQCRMCINQSAQGACQTQAQACFMNGECQAILDCHKQCGWGGPCTAQCDDAHPQGQFDFKALIQCGGCQQCPMQCSGSPIDAYCAMSGTGGAGP